ncbi:MAG: hypothetical protein ACTSRZ_11610, partial [Promethearchaeota archaeon]
MSKNTNLSIINQNFIKFGKYYYLIGWLTIINLIISFAPRLIQTGSYVLSFATLIIQITQFIAFLLIIAVASKTNNILNNNLLGKFCSKFKASIILMLIGNLINTLSNLFFPLALANLVTYLRGTLTSLPVGTMRQVGLMVIGMLLIYISYILTYIAYKSLQGFFNTTKSNFPDNIGIDAEDSAGKLKTSALMNILIFLIITALIGFIYNLIG